MGKLAKIVKERTCLLCKETFHTDSSGLKDHFSLCVRAKRLGLVLPGRVERPKTDIVVLS